MATTDSICDLVKICISTLSFLELHTGFLQLFAQGGNKVRLYGLSGGGGRGRASKYPRANMWQTRRIRRHALPGNFDFGLLLDTNWWNQGLFRIIYH